jgi:tetratricopeptide (TPR) repeat protein
MLKRIFIIAVLCFFTCNIFAQEGNYIDSLLNWIKMHPTIDSQYIQTLHRLSYRYSEKDVKKSYHYYQQVSQISDSLNFTFGKSLAQINLGLLLLNSASFDASNTAFFKSIDYADSCAALRLKSASLNNIADNFLSLRNYSKCREYTKKAIPLNMQLIPKWGTRGVAINYELLFRCDFNQKLYATAKSNLDKGKPFALSSGDSYVLSQYDLGMAKLMAVDNKSDSAKFYFDKAINEAKTQSDLRNEFEAYLGKAKFLKTLSAKKKLILLDSALSIARNTQYFEGISDAAEQISIVYDQAGMTDSALAYFRLYRAGFDSLFSQNTSLNLIINESGWLVKKKQIENNHLLELSQLQKRQIVFKNALLLAALILLFLTIVAAFFIHKSIQAKKKRTEFIFKQKIAESQIQSLRAQMNPHFIFNSLNSIENFMMQNEKRKASDYLHKFALLIRTILDSSREAITSVSQDMEALKLYIDLEQMRFNNKFCYQEIVDQQLLTGDYNVPSLLIQPYVENAIVHGIAHSDKANLKLTVSATLENDHIKYVIEDNGIGREQAEKYKRINKLHHRSIGLKITEDRVHLFNQNENSNGHIRITDLYAEDNTPDGTRIEVRLKVI